jgi:hypothetical protein
MADAALFVGWGNVVRGREQRGLEVFNEALQYYADLQRKKEIESFEVVLLEQHGGDLNGFVLIRGDEDRLAKLRNDQEFQRRILRAQLIVDNIGVVGGLIGNSINRTMADYMAELEKLKGAVAV